MCTQCKDDIVLDLKILSICKVVNLEEFLDFFHTFLCQVYLWLKNHDLLPDVSALTARWFRFGYAGHTGQDGFTSGVFLFISALVIPLVAWGFCPF